jgi:cytochrome b subunit of formate dehydrogenase
VKVSPNSKTRIRRFTPVQQGFHLLLILAFLAQGATGLARLYIETAWGKRLAWVLGGYDVCLSIHKYVGILMICLFLAHVAYVLSRVDWKRFPASVTGPDSLVPRAKDLKDFFLHVGWFLNVTRPPEFDRWGYWEKFDYWAVFWGIPLLGVTGLLLAYPMTASRIMPGWGLNVALWIHRIEAILAMCHVFIIHFFIAHLRRHNFPMDRTMFEGSADLTATRHERPAWVARLQQAGTLDSLLVPEATEGFRAASYVLGYLFIAVAIYLLIGGLVNSPYITW